MTSSTHSVETNAPQPMATPSETCAQSSPSTKSRSSQHSRCRSIKQSQTYYIPTILLLSVRQIAAEDGSFTGQWNGEWTANSNSNMYDDDAVGDENRVYSMWKDDDYLSPKMSTDTFILDATAAILSTLTILFCLCHPEILTVICLKLKNCCCNSSSRRGGGGETSKNGVVGSSASDDYVGGIQMERRQDGESERELV